MNDKTLKPLPPREVKKRADDLRNLSLEQGDPEPKMKVYILESGLFSSKKIKAFSSKDKLLTYRDNEIMEKWEKYSNGPMIRYRNAEIITAQTWDEFRDEMMMDYEMVELEIQ